MIKVKIERPHDNVFYVQDGVTVQYAGEGDTIVEVLDEEDSIIAVFRGWVYALPITDEEYLIETGQADEDLEEEPEEDLEDEDDEEEADFVAPETSSYAHVNSHGEYGLADDTTEDSAL